MKNTENIKKELAGLATLNEEDTLKAVAKISAWMDEDNKDYEDLSARHVELAKDYGTLVVKGTKAQDDPTPPSQPQTLEQIVDSVLKKGK